MKTKNLSARSKKIMLSTDSTAEKTVGFLEREGYICEVESWTLRTRASGSDGLPGKKNWRHGERCYAWTLTAKGRAAGVLESSGD